MANPYKRNKYRNKKTTIDGITFDSKAEAAYYQHLKFKQKTGEVNSFEMQVSYTLLDKFAHPATGKTVRAITYKPDFVVTYKNGSRAVLDVKGVQTTVFKLKAKLFMQRYNLPLVLVKYDSRSKTFSHVSF